MDNHYHQATSYKDSFNYLSKHMRHAHSLFGARYNKIHKRSGKVAESRPKTALIENTEHEMRVHFYIEANPIRANICKPENLRSYKYNSFKFYAYGIKDEYTNLLTIPEWYMELGKNQKERQRKYRRLFYEYLSEHKSTNTLIFEQNFIGSTIWKLKQEKRVSSFRKEQIVNTS
jgi:putative transposase